MVPHQLVVPATAEAMLYIVVFALLDRAILVALAQFKSMYLKNLDGFWLQVLRGQDRAEFSARCHRHCRPQRLRQIQCLRCHPLGAGRAIGQGVARRRNGRRDFQRHGRPQTDGHGRGVAHARRRGRGKFARGGRRGGLRRGDAHAPDFPRRQQRVFSEQGPLPAQGHPATVHGHGRRAHELQHPGAGPHHADPFEQAGRPPDDFRGGGGHHEIQEPEEENHSANWNTRSKIFCAWRT